MNNKKIIETLKEWNPWWSNSFFNNKHIKILATIYYRQLSESKEEALKRYNAAKLKYPDFINEIDCVYYDRFISY